MSVRYGILTLLYYQQHHGYELKVQLDLLFGIKGKVNPGQIYTTVDRLIRDQLVSSVEMDEQERKVYKINEEGKSSLENWLLEPVPYYSTKESFQFKWSCARKIFFQKEKQMLDQHKVIVMKEVMELTKLKTEFLLNGNENNYLLITGILLHLEAELSWINKIENRNQ